MVANEGRQGNGEAPLRLTLDSFLADYNIQKKGMLCMQLGETRYITAFL